MPLKISLLIIRWIWTHKQRCASVLGFFLKTYKQSNLSWRLGFLWRFPHLSWVLQRLYQFTPKFQIVVECLDMNATQHAGVYLEAWEKRWNFHRTLPVANSKQHHTGIKHTALVTSNPGGCKGHEGWGRGLENIKVMVCFRALEACREVVLSNPWSQCKLHHKGLL